MVKKLLNKLANKINGKKEKKIIKHTKKNNQELTQEQMDENIKAAYEAYQAEKREMSPLEFQDTINNELWLNDQGG